MRFHVGLLLLLSSAGPIWAQDQLTAKHLPPARMIDIGGRKLHLNCYGKGSPTVILMTGAGAFSIDWALVQPKVASLTRVCAYDRAGLAWSDPGPADETVEQTLSDLHLLLRAASEKGPYVLVGASIGGIFIRAYQRAFPKEVVGLVFTNSSNRVGKVVKEKGALIWDFTEDELRSAYPLHHLLSKGLSRLVSVNRLIDSHRNCKQSAYGSTCGSGKSGMRARLVLELICLGEKNFCGSSRK